MAKKAYIGVEKLTTTAVDLADVDSLQEFWVGRYDPYGNVPEWNSQSGGYEFSGNSVYAQDFYREINDGRLQVESNTIYFIPDSYPQYYVKVIYINYQQSLQPDEFIAYKTENKGVARKIRKGYIGIQTPVISETSTGKLLDDDADGYGYFASSYSLNNETLQFTINCNIKATITDAASNGYFCPENNGQLLTNSGTYTVSTICKAGYDLSQVGALGVYNLTASLQGVASKIKKAYIGDENGVARLCWASVDSVFANNTWADIIAACESGSVPDTWTVGDQKTMTINGTDYVIDIIGKNHDTYSDGSGTAPLTFQLHDCYGTTAYRMNSSSTNENGWSNTEMRNTTLPAILALMPNEVQTAIKQVTKKCSYGGMSTTINTTRDKLFLLSEIEVFGTNEESVSGEGSQYDYYKAGNSKVKIFNGSAWQWWTRSARSYNSTSFRYVSSSGNGGYSGANTLQGVSFAFCF